MTPPDPRPATAADRDRVVETVVAAFVADPAFRYFFPAEADYPAHAAAFAAYLFDARVVHATVWVAEDGAAVAMWEPPGASGHAGLGAALDLPADTLARIEAYERAVYGSMPAEPHWYLGVLATHPQRAGLRLGRSVMGAGLQQAVADGVPAILETVNAANVELYRRSGWEVAATVPFEGLQVRVMSHPGPRADASA